MQVVSTGHKISRSQIRTAASEDVAIGMVLDGTGAVGQGGRTYGHLGSINPYTAWSPSSCNSGP